MDEQQLISHIEELGLSNKEARVYVACLMVGPSPVQRIADQSGIKRVTTYVILESLVGLGLVSQSMKGKKTYFIAEDPNNLHRLIEKREHELKEQKLNFEHILPELNDLKSIPKDSPNVQFYDGAEGIKAIFSSFYSNMKPGTREIYGISNLDQLHAFFPDLERASSNPERVKYGLHSKFIYTSKRGPIYQASDTDRNRESRFIPYDRYPLSGDLTIVGDRIIMVSLTGQRPIGITIQSADLAAGMRAMFEILWDSSRQFNQQ